MGEWGGARHQEAGGLVPVDEAAPLLPQVVALDDAEAADGLGAALVHVVPEHVHAPRVWGGGGVGGRTERFGTPGDEEGGGLLGGDSGLAGNGRGRDPMNSQNRFIRNPNWVPFSFAMWVP